MSEMNLILDELNSRLPELEWKLNKLKSGISVHNLPKGLFSIGMEFSAAACIQEIRSNLKSLSNRKNDQGAFFLAERIKQKINVLVILCQIHHGKKKQEESNSFKLETLSTRKQWVESMESKIWALEGQHQAMLKTLSQKKNEGDSSAILPLQAELGEIQKKLTLAREMLNRRVNML